MKIAIVCFNLGWQSGGPRLIFSSARALRDAGHRVTIYTQEFSGEYFKELWHGLDIRVVPPHLRAPTGHPRNFFDWVFRKWQRERADADIARRIADALETDIDILNVHDYAYPVAHFYKMRNPAVRALWTSNDPPYAYLRKPNIFADLASRIYNTAKEYQSKRFFRAINHAIVLDFYNERWCAARGIRATIVRLGVDARFSLPVKDIAARAHAKQITLFGLGSLNRYRRYEDLIRAVGILRKAGYDARATIIANDQWNEQEYRNALTLLLQKDGLQDAVSIRFTGVSEEGLHEAFRASDVFVYAMYVPPPRDGFGFSMGVFEAMAAGLPVILCRTTTAVEVLEDRQSALFVDPMSPESIALQVRFLLDHPDAYRTIALSGQALVKNELTWERYVAGMLAVIQ